MKFHGDAGNAKMEYPFIDDRICKIHADFCSVFANPTRLKLLWLLDHEEASVSELSEILGLSVQNVSQHLRMMRERGAVEDRKEGKQVFYRVRNGKFLQACRLIRDGILEEMKKRSEVMETARSL